MKALRRAGWGTSIGYTIGGDGGEPLRGVLTPLRIIWIAGAIVVSVLAIGNFVEGEVAEGLKAVGAVVCFVALAILVPHWGAMLGRPRPRRRDERDTPEG